MTYADSGETMGEAQRKDEILKSFFARAEALLKKFNPVSAPGQLAMKWLVGCPSSPMHPLESPNLTCASKTQAEKTDLRLAQSPELHSVGDH